MPCLFCELPNLLANSMPPDPDLVDLIENAFIEGQIDRLDLEAELAYLWLRAKWADFGRIATPVATP